jgi:hypothetical protein
MHWFNLTMSSVQSSSFYSLASEWSHIKLANIHFSTAKHLCYKSAIMFTHSLHNFDINWSRILPVKTIFSHEDITMPPYSLSHLTPSWGSMRLPTMADHSKWKPLQELPNVPSHLPLTRTLYLPWKSSLPLIQVNEALGMDTSLKLSIAPTYVAGSFGWPHFTSLPVPTYQVGTKH